MQRTTIGLYARRREACQQQNFHRLCCYHSWVTLLRCDVIQLSTELINIIRRTCRCQHIGDGQSLDDGKSGFDMPREGESRIPVWTSECHAYSFLCSIVDSLMLKLMP